MTEIGAPPKIGEGKSARLARHSTAAEMRRGSRQSIRRNAARLATLDPPKCGEARDTRSAEMRRGSRQSIRRNAARLATLD
jgi:hypothetical protein